MVVDLWWKIFAANTHQFGQSVCQIECPVMWCVWNIQFIQKNPPSHPFILWIDDLQLSIVIVDPSLSIYVCMPLSKNSHHSQTSFLFVASEKGISCSLSAMCAFFLSLVYFFFFFHFSKKYFNVLHPSSTQCIKNKIYYCLIDVISWCLNHHRTLFFLFHFDRQVNVLRCPFI